MLNLTAPLYGQQNPFTQIRGNADQGITLPQPVPLVTRQDPSALQEIQAYRNAVGAGSWTDMHGKGLLTSTAIDSDGGVHPKNAELWILGHDQYRLDIQKSNGISSVRIAGANSIVQDADGSQNPMDARDAASGLIAFPRLMDANLFVANLMLIDLGMVTVDGSVLHGITVESPWPGNVLDANGNLFTTATNLYFDPQTHLLVKSATATTGQRAIPQRFLRVITYADYRTVGVMQLPFQYRETLNGQILWTLQLTTVQLNQGLTQSGFQF